jgi:hypothetical protein
MIGVREGFRAWLVDKIGRSGTRQEF